MESQPDENDLAAVILAQHKEIKHLLQALGGASVNGRNEPLQALLRLLKPHETVEQTFVYPALREMGDDGARIADARLAEEHKAEEAIAEMERMDLSSARFAEAFIGFRSDVDQHAAREEANVLPLLANLGEEDARRIAQAFLAAAGSAPAPAFGSAESQGSIRRSA